MSFLVFVSTSGKIFCGRGGRIPDKIITTKSAIRLKLSLSLQHLLYCNFVNHVSLADESWIVKDQFETNLYKNLHVVFFHVFPTDLLILCKFIENT